ncbi:MAG TPA: thiamine pyrophosphate-dependent enzyme [Stellaceae bacterium]|jgi:acetolactate synthase-1/2/3 large subunit|nr:thiamine pyrophosphate-dependent enzyme [Stellaceae bacterium]
MTVMTGARALVQGLKANAIDTVFGLPGVQLDYIFDALYGERNSIRVIESRHEQGAAYMAYGYAESTGKLGTYLVVPGPGLLNTATALCTAHASNAPMLALTGQIPTRYMGRGLGILHEIPSPELTLSQVTKYQSLSCHASVVPDALNRCIEQAMSGRRGPVLFQIPQDSTMERGDVGAIERARTLPEPVPDPDLIEAAAKLLGAAKHPAILAGGGVYGAEEPLLALASMLQAPVIMTRHGRGAVSDRHYLAQTLMGGHVLWPEVDVVLAVGTRFLEAEWGLDERIRTIRLDVDALQAERPVHPDVKLIGNAAACLTALANRVGAHNRVRESREDELRGVKAACDEKLASQLAPQKAFSDAVRAALPDDGIVVADITQVGFFTWVGFPAYRPRSLIYPGFQDSLGYGYATALGVTVANPGKPVVALCGDGGFMFTMPEMATAVNHNIPLVAVVFNDRGFGNVRRAQQTIFGGRTIASDLHNPDFVKLAEAFGMRGQRVADAKALHGALREAIAAGGPALIEVPVGAMPSWQTVMPRGRARAKTAIA